MRRKISNGLYITFIATVVVLSGGKELLLFIFPSAGKFVAARNINKIYRKKK